MPKINIQNMQSSSFAFDKNSMDNMGVNSVMASSIHILNNQAPQQNQNLSALSQNTKTEFNYSQV